MATAARIPPGRCLMKLGQKLSSVASVTIMAIVGNLTCAEVLSGQNIRYSHNACADLVKHWPQQQNSAVDSKYWEQVVAAAREFLTHCKDRINEQEEAATLWKISVALDHLGKYEDALPLTRRCAAIKPDAAYCFTEMGQSFEGLGRQQDAIESYRGAIAIGGYDEVNALSIELAKSRLAALGSTPRDDSPNLRGGSTPPSSEPSSVTLGTGFFVSKQGHILTNSHVVSGCRVIQTSNHERLRILERNAAADLALLIGEMNPPSVAVFRSGSEPQVGESVIVFGFPLPGLLTTEGNLSTGTISAMKGLEDDPIFMQVSAPMQPGNSGGALLDEYGNVIGVVVAKLDALEVAAVTGDIPQNVNFAVKWSQVTAFLDRAKVPYQTEPSNTILKTADIAAAARKFTVPIECVQ